MLALGWYFYGQPSFRKGDVATPGFIEILDRAPEHERHWQEPAPKGVKTSYRRRALAHRAAGLEYAGRFSRGLTAAQTDQFVGMYVNQFTVDYGVAGRRAVAELLERGARAGILPRVDLQFIGASP